MITQLLNTAVLEGRDHTATNDEIWSKAKSFGFIEKLKDSDQCVLTTEQAIKQGRDAVILYYLHGQKRTKRKSMLEEPWEDEQSNCSSQPS